MKPLLSSVISVFVLGAGLTGVQAATSSEKAQKLLTEIHQANLMEVELGQLAAQKAQSKDVKDYAQKMVSAHREADQKVLRVAENQKVRMEAARMEKAAQKREALNKKTGADFESNYITEMVNGHEKLLGKLNSSVNDLPEGEVRSLVQELIPTVQHHLEMAKQIQTDMKAAPKS